MTGAPVIGIVGAAGAVGNAVARALVARPTGAVRLGARRPDALRPSLSELGGRAEGVAVDVAQPASLARFCAGCRVVVNCVGPLVARRAEVAAAARAAGADYVDPGGDDALRRDLADQFPAPVEPGGSGGAWVAILGAGVMPGLSGLVPRWLATQGLDPPLRLNAYVSTLDLMTPGSAVDFVRSLVDAYGEPNASWRAGAKVSRDLAPLHRAELPFFAGPVVAYPYLSAETERLARSLRLVEVRWYHVFDADGRVLPALSRFRADLRRGAAATELAVELCRAVELEMFGRSPVQRLVFELRGWTSGRPAHRVAVLRASSTYELTATVTAATVAELLVAALPTGLHFAADALDPALVARLPGSPGVVGLHVLDGPLVAYAELDQGAI